MRSRVALVVLLALLSGCAGSAPTQTTNATHGNATTADASGANATTPTPPVGARGELVTEKFILMGDHSLAFLFPEDPATPPVASVPESFTGSAFFTSTDPASALPPWEGPVAQRSFEITRDVSIAIKFTTPQPAATATKALQFPTVGGWFGTKERWAVYFSAPDAPDTIQPGQTYTVRMTAKMPETGLFVRAGERLALHTYLGYQTVDSSALSYVVGGADAAGLAVPHVHFNVTAPNATVVLDKSGTLSPNPAPSTTQDPQPTDLTFDVPTGTVYVVAVVDGTPSGGGKLDVDLALKAGTVVLGSSAGPGAHEVVELGPTALAKAGGKLTAHVAGAGPAGGTFKLVVTAHGA